MPDRACICFLIHIPDKGEFDILKFGVLITDGRKEECAGGQKPHHSAVFPGEPVKIIGCDQATAAGQILNGKGWIARDIATKMACEDARIHVVAAAWSGGDYEIDGLVSEKMCGILCMRLHAHKTCQTEHRGARHEPQRHP